MKNFTIFSLCFESGHEVSNPEFRSFESYLDAINYFYYLVGLYTFLLRECSSRIPSISDSYCLKSFCVSNGSISYYIYLQKNS